MHGLLLFAHGARDPAWARPFLAIAQRIRARHSGGPVELAYLELMTPDLGTAVDSMVQAGCTRVTMVPLFLGAGGHVKRDLPALLEGQRQRHPGLVVHSTCAIGESDAVIAALADAAHDLALQAPDGA
jgi:sirohydrochlorin cobaltochelatase